MSFSNFKATDPAGNFITYNPSNVSSSRTITVDNLDPSVTSVELSTDNLSKTLFDNTTGVVLSHQLLARFGDNITLSFETRERILDPVVSINGHELDATRQPGDISGTRWRASYIVKDNDSGLIVFSNFKAEDPAGNKLTYDRNAVTSTKSIMVDNQNPYISSIELSSDNILSGTLYDDTTGLSRDNDSVARLGDNVTLKFETAERVIDTRVYFNGNERTATPQVISGDNDTTGTKWEAVYNVSAGDNGLVGITFTGSDPAGNSITHDNSAVTSVRSVTMDHSTLCK